MGWQLLYNFKHLPDDVGRMEVVRQLFDHMSSNPHEYITNAINRGINYDMICMPRDTENDPHEAIIQKNDDRGPIGQLATYLWGLMEYNKLFVDQSVAGSLSDDFPHSLEYVNPTTLILITSPITAPITNLARTALIGRHV